MGLSATMLFCHFTVCIMELSGMVRVADNGGRPAVVL